MQSTVRRGAMLLTLVVSAGCVHAQAKTVGPDPVLTTPDPPARVLVPVPPESLLPPPTPPAEPPSTPTTGRATGTRPAPTPTPPVTTAPPPENPPPPAASVALLESQAKERLDQADKMLARLKRETLGGDARDNYDSAARYIRLARQAIAEKNFVYAKNCADKAAIIAGLLVKLEVRSQKSGVR